jgi:hypothetical protein
VEVDRKRAVPAEIALTNALLADRSRLALKNVALRMHVTPDGVVWAVGQHFNGKRTVPVTYRLAPASPRWSVYGSKVNPPASLRVLSGKPALGTVLTLGLDNPLGTQSVGAATFLYLALGPDRNYPSGTKLPGFGMGGAGVPGELLLDVGPSSLVGALVGPAWRGRGIAAPISLAIPNTANLVGFRVYFQGLLVDKKSVAGLTRGLEAILGR